MKDAFLTEQVFALPPAVDIPEAEFKAFLTDIFNTETSNQRSTTYNSYHSYSAYSSARWQDSSILKSGGANTELCYDFRLAAYPSQLELVYAHWRSIAGGYQLESVFTHLRVILKQNSGWYSKYPKAQEKERFADCKLMLEQISFLIKDYPLKKKQAYLLQLAPKLSYGCGDVLYNALADAVLVLRSEEQISIWLAKDRLTQLNNLGQEIFEGKGEVWDKSAELACLILADKEGWGVASPAKIRELEGQLGLLEALKPEIEEALVAGFEQIITRAEVLGAVCAKYREILENYNKMDLSNTRHFSDLKKFMATHFADGDQDKLNFSNILDYDDNYKMAVSAEYLDNTLPQMCKGLLEKEGYLLTAPSVKRQPTAKVQPLYRDFKTLAASQNLFQQSPSSQPLPSQPSQKVLRLQWFIDNELINPLRRERERLESKYGSFTWRAYALADAIQELRNLMSNVATLERKSQVATAGQLQNILYRRLLNNNQMQKYNWASTLVLSLVNLITAVLIVPALFKYAVTGSCFFSLQGKSQEKALEVHANAARANRI